MSLKNELLQLETSLVAIQSELLLILLLKFIKNYMQPSVYF